MRVRFRRFVSPLDWVFIYYWSVFRRAIRDTMEAIGWKRQSLIFLVTYIIGFFLFVRGNGFQHALDALIEDYYLVFIPLGIGALILFVVNLVMAPVRIWQEGRREATPSDKIAEFLLEGELLKDEIYNADAQRTDAVLWQRLSVWRTQVTTWLHQNISPMIAMVFSGSVTVDGTIQHRFRGRVLEQTRESAIQHMEQYLQRLTEIAKPYV